MLLRRTDQPACSGGSRYCSCMSLEDAGGMPGRQVVVQQDGAGIEVLQPQAAPAAHHRLEQHRARRLGQGDRRRLLDARGRSSRCARSARPCGRCASAVHVAQVEGVAGVRSRGSAAGSSPRGRSSRSPPSPPAPPAAASPGVRLFQPPGIQVGVHRRQLEAGVAHVDRAVERRRVLHPFEPEPALDGRHRLEDALLEFVDRAGQGGDEMGNHGGHRAGGGLKILGFPRRQKGRPAGGL